jgi:membrane fusion protein (multidrug efflux system)
MFKNMFKATAFLAVSAVIFSCNSQTSTDADIQQELKEIPVINIKVTDTILPVEYVADIQSVKNVEIHPRVNGILERIYIKEGQSVAAYQIMFKINDSDLQIELSKATAAYNSVVADMKVAEVEMQRVQTLYDKKVIPASEVELSKAKYNAAKSKVDQAMAEKEAVRKLISYTEVRAPFSGVVDRIEFKEGSIVNEASILTSVSDNSSMFAYFNVSEKIYFDMMEQGGEDQVNQVRLILPNGSLYKHRGEIKPAESEISAATGSIAYKAVFANPEKLLKHGASGKLILDQTVNNAFLIPQKSVLEIQDKYYVYVVDAQHKVKMYEFKPHSRVANCYIVTTGFKGDEIIVLEGVKSLRDGETIAPKMQNI